RSISSQAIADLPTATGPLSKSRSSISEPVEFKAIAAPVEFCERLINERGNRLHVFGIARIWARRRDACHVPRRSHLREHLLGDLSVCIRKAANFSAVGQNEVAVNKDLNHRVRRQVLF